MMKLIFWRGSTLIPALALPLLCQADAQELNRLLGVILAAPVKAAHVFEATRRPVAGPVEKRVERLFQASLELEADQRGYFNRVPSYRVLYAYESIRERFTSKDSYDDLREAIQKETGQPGLLFQIDWKSPLASEASFQKTLNSQIRTSRSSWSPTLLQWNELPATEAEFKASLESQLNEQYLATTRNRVLQEILAEELPSCLQSAITPSPKAIQAEYEATRDHWVSQKTDIDLITVRFESPEAAKEFLARTMITQVSELEKFEAAGPQARRSEWNELRAGVLQKLKDSSTNASWSQKRLRWPIEKPEDTESLDERQINFALTAPLGSVLLPTIIEGSELWIVSGESREQTVALSLEDTQVYNAVRRRVQQRIFAGCAKTWFTRFAQSRISIPGGESIAQSEFDLFFESMAEGSSP